MSFGQLLRVALLLACIQGASHQEQPKNPSELDPSNPGEGNKLGDRTDINKNNRPESGRIQFYMDSASDCSPVVRETGDRDVIVYGRGAIQAGASLLTCTLSLRVDQPRDPQRYKVSLLEMRIQDCNVAFYIYDGVKGSRILGRYGCPENTDTNYKSVLWTSGNQLTFFIQRRSRENTDYSIRIQVAPIGSDNWTEWPQNPDYNRFYKFEQKWVVLIVGLGYAVISLMTLLLLAICYCCIRGDGEKWQQSRFGIVNPAMSGSGTKSTLNSAKPNWSTSKPYTSNGKANGQLQRNGSLRRTPMNVKKRMAGGSEDVDSVFESDGAVTRKNPPVKRYSPRQSVPQSRGVHLRNGKSLGNGRGSDESYVQADDDHPQDLFVEREIIIPAKKKPKYRKEEEYSSEEELSSGGEEIEKVSSAMNTDPEMKDGGVQYSEQEESEEEEEESDGGESDEPEHSVVYAKPRKNQEPTTPRWEAQQPVTQPAPASLPQHTGRRTPLGDMEEYMPQYPANGHWQPDYRQPDYTQPDYHQQGYRQPDYRQPDYRQPDYRQPGYGDPQSAPYAYHSSDVPSQPSKHSHYPNMAPPPYQTSGQYPRYTPEPYYPTYEDNQYHPRSGVRPDPRSHYPLVDSVPKDPPIYSYLVRRGYNPVDAGRQSPVSSNNSLENRLGGMEESDVSANLDSGVEIMRR